MEGSEYSAFLIKPIPEWVTLSSGAPSEVDESVTSAPYYFSLVEYQDRVEEEQIFSFQKTVETINDSSRIEDASLQIFELHPLTQAVWIHAVEIIRDGRVLDRLNPDNIKAMQRETALEQHIVDERITVSISVDDLRVGDTITKCTTIVEQRGDHPLMGKFYYANFWLNWGCPVVQQRVRIINQSRKNLTVLHATEVDGIEQHREEILAPAATFDQTYKHLMPASVPDYVPNHFWGAHLNVVTEASWVEISQYMHQYYKQVGALFTGVGQDLERIDGLDLSGKSDSEVLLAIVRFVQNEVRYRGENHGIFTHTPKSPLRTLEKRAGDCKDKSNLLFSILHAKGYDARLFLVNTRQGEKVAEHPPSPYAFNHMIVEVQYEGKHYYFDPTDQYTGGDIEHLAEQDYGYGLRINETGSDLIEIRRDLTNKVFELIHHFDFRKSSQPPRLDITRHFYHHRADNMRRYFASRSPSQLQEDYHGYARSDTGMELSVKAGLYIVSDDKEANELITEEIYEIHNLDQTHPNGRAELVTSFLADYPAGKDIRGDYPVRLDVDGAQRHVIYAKYDRHAGMEPTEETIQSQFLDYRDKVFYEQHNVIKYDTELCPKTAQVTVSQLPAYKNVSEKLRARSNNLVATRPPKAVLGIDKGTFSYILAFLFAIAWVYFWNFYLD